MGYLPQQSRHGGSCSRPMVSLLRLLQHKICRTQFPLISSISICIKLFAKRPLRYLALRRVQKITPPNYVTCHTTLGFVGSPSRRCNFQSIPKLAPACVDSAPVSTFRCNSPTREAKLEMIEWCAEWTTRSTIKLYQHRPQIAKTNFLCYQCMQEAQGSFSGCFFWMPLLCRVPWAPCNGTTSTPPKLVVTLAPNHSTLQWRPTMAPSNAPRPLHPAMAPWCHVQSAKVVRRPPSPMGSKDPYGYPYLGNKAQEKLTNSWCVTHLLKMLIPLHLLTLKRWYQQAWQNSRGPVPAGRSTDPGPGGQVGRMQCSRHILPSFGDISTMF